MFFVVVDKDTGGVAGYWCTMATASTIVHDNCCCAALWKVKWLMLLPPAPVSILLPVGVGALCLFLVNKMQNKEEGTLGSYFDKIDGWFIASQRDHI
eukprot:scaffold336165_cov31-Attheya_sp.AAC.1